MSQGLDCARLCYRSDTWSDVHYKDLHPLTITAAEIARKSLDKKAFRRYQCKSKRAVEKLGCNFLFDVILYFNPACRTLSYLKPIMKQYDTDKGKCI